MQPSTSYSLSRMACTPQDNSKARQQVISRIKYLDYHSRARFDGSYKRIYKAPFLPFSEYLAEERLKIAQEQARVAPFFTSNSKSGTTEYERCNKAQEGPSKTSRLDAIWGAFSGQLWNGHRIESRTNMAYLETLHTQSMYQDMSRLGGQRPGDKL